MAIRDFKNIEKINQELEQTAQILKPTDLNIFKTSAKNVADFGLSKNDAIEFRLYDISNNLLEQTNGVKVRYIHKNELPTYLKNSLDEVTGEKIFEIDVEKLVFEAGYGNGEFRVSFGFVKNYVGNENIEKRVWIHEVSPSRTEIRVLPLIGTDKAINADLQDRYYSFMDNVSELRQSYKEIQQFLDKIEVNISTLIDDYFISSFGPKYIEVINKDFVFGGAEGYTNFKNKVYTDFRKSVMNEIDGKQFRLGATDYGQQILPTIDLDDFVSTTEFRLIIQNRLHDSVEYNMQFLRKREYTLAYKEANGQYKPSKELQSLLSTGYNSVTKLQSIADTTGVGSTTTNKTTMKAADITVTETVIIQPPLPTYNDPFTAADDRKKSFAGVLPDLSPGANKPNNSLTSTVLNNITHQLKNYSPTDSKKVVFQRDGTNGILEIILEKGQQTTICAKDGTVSAPQGYISISKGDKCIS